MEPHLGVVLGIAIALLGLSGRHAQEDAGHLVGDPGEILGAQASGGRHIQLIHVQYGDALQAGTDLLDLGVQLLVLLQHGAAAAVFHPGFSAEGGGGGGGDGFDPLLHLRTHLVAQGADGAGHHGLLRDDIGGVAAVHLADGQHQRLGGIHLTGADGLERQKDVGHGVEGVDAVVGLGAVAALSGDMDGEPVHGRELGVYAGKQKGAHGQRDVGHDVHTHGRVYLGVFQHTAFDHHFAAVHGLFGGLEHQLDHALQLRLMGLQQLGCPQQRGGVAVMAAGVHIAVGGLEFHVGLLLHRQGVHVAAEEEAFAAGLSNRGNKAAFADAAGRIAHFLQLFFHISRGFGQMKPGFRVLMQMVSIVYKGLLNVQRFLIQVHGNPAFL